MGNGRLGGDAHAIAHGQVPRNAHLASQDDVVAQGDAPGDAHLGDDDAVPPDGHVMGDLDQVVDLDAFLNPCLAEGRPIHGAVGADFHIVVDLDDPRLGNFGGAPWASWANPNPSLPITVPE